MVDRASDRGGRTWWSRRFLDAVEAQTLAGPLRGGRRLVRTEAVTSVRRTENLVVAMVRDDEATGGRIGDRSRDRARDGDRRPDVHKARLAVRMFDSEQWTRVETALATQAGYAASLLSGSMPAQVDRVFANLGLSLFPTGADDLATDCSCDDWLRPCAHVAAACYQLATDLDADPFELLALRGREREPLLDALRRRRPGPLARSRPKSQADPPSTPLPVDATRFWAGTASAARTSWRARPLADTGTDAGTGTGTAGHPDDVLDQCGPLVMDGSGDLRELLRPMYRAFTSS